MSPAGAVLQATDLRVWYGTEGDPVRAVDGVSLEIEAGATLGVVGESGCGKSTLGRGILGLLPEGAATAGSVRFRDSELLELSPADLRELRGPELGMIFQEPMTRLDPLLSVEDHFLETMNAHRPSSGARRCAAWHWRRWPAWESRRHALPSIRTSSRAACASGS